ncbi:hypothetical protein [Siminovitchia fordii]|nr:hypothetical protein [Siminovitchia fordii]
MIEKRWIFSLVGSINESVGSSSLKRLKRKLNRASPKKDGEAYFLIKKY